MNKGDIVMIDDGSYSKTIKDNKLVHGPGGDRYVQDVVRKQYTIIETGCNFPKTGSRTNTFNNIVIQAIDSGKVVFIEERFLCPVPPTHKVMIDIIHFGGYRGTVGHVVEISDKLYKEIKQS